jgi:hypothetical protein
MCVSAMTVACSNSSLYRAIFNQLLDYPSHDVVIFRLDSFSIRECSAVCSHITYHITGADDVLTGISSAHLLTVCEDPARVTAAVL